ncbi:MAG: winged helix-turn-helix transcriptional regulator [Gammaproteobacteria bacterium]|nr:winged helix-turn-helix transcriptional regulator [Gammaproteobacteria bacterium]
MHALDLLADPVRRRILELLARGELSSGDIVAVIQTEFGISQSAVSQHLRVLRDNGFATVRSDGPRRIYSIEPGPLLEIDAWLEPFRSTWEHRLEALATEVARGKRERRAAATGAKAKRSEPGQARVPPSRKARRAGNANE